MDINDWLLTAIMFTNINSYYIDRCELWGFIREINSDISCVKYQFFSRRNYFYTIISVVVTSLFVLRWIHPFCKLKKFCEMLLTTLPHNQYDVISVIWRLPDWNVKIRHYLASCTLQFWLNLTKISFQGKHFNYHCVLL